PVDYGKLNKALNTARQDILIIYKEIANLEDAIVRNFNNLTSYGEKIKTKLKQVRSQVGTYKLYSNSSDLLYFSDSFDSFTNIDQTPSFYDSTICNVNLLEGTVTLPIDTSASGSPPKITSISISNASNGTSGNNQEIGALQRANLANMYDGNLDTWFEYEIVSSSASGSPLILELNISLDSPAIINNITIDFTNFAASSFPVISELTTSLDNKFFVDLIQDIPIATTSLETKQDVLTLSPASGKFTGSASFSFKPRKAQY